MTQNKTQSRNFFKGDKVLWYIIIAISIFSFFPVYSASTNLQYIVGEGTTIRHLGKHAGLILFGLGIMAGVTHFIKYEWIGKLSGIVLILMVPVLLLASYFGSNIGGASAGRWVSLGPVRFQPSTFAYLVLIVYLCRHLAKNMPKNKEEISYLNHALIIVPILVIFGLIAKDNGSTALMILIMSIVVLVVGQYPLKYIIRLGAIAVVGITMFLFVALNTNIFKNTRVHTWISRVETFVSSDKLNESENEALKAKNYQINQAKAAIVHGGLLGVGPGKSALKHSLPQSASDFIFAIVVEEYGLLGAAMLMGAYFIILMRIVIIATKIPTFYGSLLVLSIGMMIFLQLAVNIAVAVNIIPVTGQPLPLISYGGTSMLVTYIQLGIVLNISSRIQVLGEEGLGEKQIAKEMNDIA
jgi:cell division protein ftsW